MAKVLLNNSTLIRILVSLYPVRSYLQLYICCISAIYSDCLSWLVLWIFDGFHVKCVICFVDIGIIELEAYFHCHSNLRSRCTRKEAMGVLSFYHVNKVEKNDADYKLPLSKCWWGFEWYLMKASWKSGLRSSGSVVVTPAGHSLFTNASEVYFVVL